MGQISDELGIQSFCFRGFKDNAKVAELLTATGSKRIELCGAHIQFDDRSQHEPVYRAYDNAGVQVCSIGVENIDIEEPALRARFDFCKLVGAKTVSVNFNPGTSDDRLKLANDLAAEYDLYMGIHNHGGYHWLGNSQMLRYIFDKAEKNGLDRLGLCLDTAWALDAKQDPVKMATDFGKRLFGVHIKDFVFDRARNQEDVVVGTGNLDLPGLLKTMKDVDFDGACVLEYEADVNDPVPALTDCVKAVAAAEC